MFDLTWFCSHMFSTSGEHPLLPVFSLLSFAWVGYGAGVPATCRSGLWHLGWRTGCLLYWLGTAVNHKAVPAPGMWEHPTGSAWLDFFLVLGRYGEEITSLAMGGTWQWQKWRVCHVPSHSPGLSPFHAVLPLLP